MSQLDIYNIINNLFHLFVHSGFSYSWNNMEITETMNKTLSHLWIIHFTLPKLANIFNSLQIVQLFGYKTSHEDHFLVPDKYHKCHRCDLLFMENILFTFNHLADAYKWLTNEVNRRNQTYKSATSDVKCPEWPNIAHNDLAHVASVSFLFK